MRKIKLCTAALLLIIGSAIFTGCTQEKNPSKGNGATAQQSSEQNVQTEERTDGGLLGTFETTTLDGAAVTQDIFAESELTMLNIWGTFCNPCIREMPELAELSDEYEGRMRLVGLISDVAEPDDETAQEIIDYTGADYTHILNSKELQNGFMSQVRGVPTTVFLDKDGRQVGQIYTGAKSKEDWAAIIEDMLTQVEQNE